jgi:23S rRNA pseudouridine2605 synthase
MSVMRLQRVLARAGVTSRRKAEQLIESGLVTVDGQVATLGSKADPDRQQVCLEGRRIRPATTRWIAFHKPLGVVTTAEDDQGRRTVFELLPKAKGLTYVGRLDVMTTGLLLLTTDGDAVHRLTHPRYRIKRSYTALVHGQPTDALAAAVNHRVEVDGRPVVTTAVRVRPGHAGRSIVDVTLTEGRNAVVRKWIAAMGAKVERLARLSYGPVRLGDLPPGDWRPLTPAETAAVYRAIDLPPT